MGSVLRCGLRTYQLVSARLLIVLSPNKRPTGDNVTPAQPRPSWRAGVSKNWEDLGECCRYMVSNTNLRGVLNARAIELGNPETTVKAQRNRFDVAALLMPDGPDYCERHADFRPGLGETRNQARERYGDQGQGKGRYSGRKRTGSPQPEIEGPEKTTKKKMGLSIKFEEKVVDAAKAASVGLHEYIYRITHDVWTFCADEQNWDESICPETEWSQAKYPSTLANTFAKGILYLRAARMPDLAARVQVLQAFTDFEELKRQVELFDAYSDKCDGEFKDPAAALRALGLSVDEATRIANGGRLSREEVKKLRRRVKKRGGLVVPVRAE